MRIPSRAPWDLAPSPFSQAVERARAKGPLLDLVESNPARAGLAPEEAAVRAAFDFAGLAAYDPEPRGLPAARAAVAGYYAAHGVEAGPEQILLTASTSEAYAWLFKVLCEPGETVAVPEPSYPLFEFLTTVEGVGRRSYRLAYDGGWHLDLATAAEALEAGARALLVVQPSNPVGWSPSAEERRALVRLCAQAGVPLIVDEVFLDADPQARTFAGETGCTTVVLSGLSKVAALPGLKCGWVVASGGDGEGILERLEVVADTFLSVGTPVQRGLEKLLRLRHPVQAALRARIAENGRAFDTLRGPHSPWSRIDTGLGWYAVLRVSATRSDEAWALALLEEGVLVHPGHLYGLGGAHLVVSLIVPLAAFREGVGRLARLLEGA